MKCYSGSNAWVFWNLILGVTELEMIIADRVPYKVADS